MALKKLRKTKIVATLLFLFLLLFIIPIGVYALSERPVDTSNIPADVSQSEQLALEDTTGTPPPAPVIPNPPALNAINPISLANSSSVTISGTVDTTGTVYISAADTQQHEATTSIIAAGVFSASLDCSALAEGVITVRAYAKSNAGLQSQVSTVIIQKDTITPSITLTSPAPGSTITEKTPVLLYTISDGVSVVKVDNRIVSKVSGDKLDTLNTGSHSITIEATDAFGNKSSKQSVFTVRSNETASVTISSPAQGAVLYTNTPQISYTTTGTNVVVKVDGSIVNKTSGSYLDTLAIGSHTLYVEALDADGNKVSDQVSFSVDTSEFAVTGTDPVSNATDADPTRVITINFNNDIKESTSTADLGITILNGTTTTQFTRAISGKALTLDPITDLEFATTYNVTIPAAAIKNLNGQGLKNDYKFSFITKTNLPAPQNLSVTSDVDALQLTWDPIDSINLSGYNVYRKTKDANDTQKVNKMVVTTNSFIDATVKADAVYVYYVVGVDKNNKEGQRSAEAEGALGMVLALKVFPDVDPNSPYKPFIDKLTVIGALNGYPNGKFMPDQDMTRAEFAKVAYFVMGGKLQAPANPSFNDVEKTDWSYQYIERTKSDGLMSGFKNKDFKPDSKVSRDEVAKVVSIIGKLPSASSLIDGAKDTLGNNPLAKYIKEEILGQKAGKTTKVKGTVPRGEVAKIMSRFVKDTKSK